MTAVFVKRYHYPRWSHRIQGMFRGTFFQASRARSEYRAMKVMRDLGIQAVRPVAYGERRICEPFVDAFDNSSGRALTRYSEFDAKPDSFSRQPRLLCNDQWLISCSQQP